MDILYLPMGDRLTRATASAKFCILESFHNLPKNNTPDPNKNQIQTISVSKYLINQQKWKIFTKGIKVRPVRNSPPSTQTATGYSLQELQY